MIDRKPIFDAVRLMLDRGFTGGEVQALDRAIDVAEGKEVPDSLWMDFAVPLIEKWEGYAKKLPDGSVEAYPDPATGGKPWTIGIGSTSDESGRPIAKGDVWSRDRAIARFKSHLAEFGEAVEIALGGAATTPEQMAAMTSLAYNVGASAFAGSTLLRKHKAGDYAGAANEFPRWNRANGRVMQGLTNRRKDEAALYRRGTYA